MKPAFRGCSWNPFKHNRCLKDWNEKPAYRQAGPARRERPDKINTKLEIQNQLAVAVGSWQGLEWGVMSFDLEQRIKNKEQRIYL